MRVNSIPTLHQSQLKKAKEPRLIGVAALSLRSRVAMSFFRCWQSRPQAPVEDATSLQPLPQAPLHGDATHSMRDARHQGSSPVVKHVIRPSNNTDVRDDVNSARDDLTMAGFAGHECPYVMTFLELGKAGGGGSAAEHGSARGVVFQNAQSSRCSSPSGLLHRQCTMLAVVQCMALIASKAAMHVPIAPPCTCPSMQLLW